jgi:hypothetical protein
MATTTPNYGWAVPTSTDLVKDGATAIETLGDAIDASMNTALGTKKAGMVLLNTTSFSGVTSQSFNNVFNATYDNYRIFYNIATTNAGDTLSLRMRASGTDNSGATNYRTSRIRVTDVSTTSRESTSSQVLVTDSNLLCAGSVDVFNPFPNNQTFTFGHSICGHNASQYITSGMRMVDNNSFDGFTIICAANMTGAISVYGVNK